MRARLLAVVAAIAVAATGCVGVPTSGPVTRVSAAPGRVNTGVEIVPAPPQPGASPVTVVEGFLHAMAAYQPDYAVARAYLTPAASARWHPEEGVRVYAEGNPVTVVDARATLKASVVGTIDGEGSYYQSHDTVDHDFGLMRDASGQWRIGNPPAGLLVSEYLFPSAFTRVMVYFPSADGDWLVPDLRFFPRGEQAHRRAAQAVTLGASAWLAPAVTAAPERLALADVGVDAAGLATITLRPGAGDLDDDARERLAAQFVWTFRQFETVTAVQVGWAGGQAWDIAPHGRIIPSSAFADADPVDLQRSRQLFGLSGGRLVRVIEGAPPVAYIPVAPGIADAAAAGVRGDAVVAAAVSSGRRLTVAPLAEQGGRSPEAPAELGRPVFSRQGELWLSDGAGGLLLAEPDGAWRTIPVEGLDGARVDRFRIAPDGARIALLIDSADGDPALGIARIERSDGVPRVEGWREIDLSLASSAPPTVLDVGWRTPDTLLALVEDGRTTQVLAVAQDGASVASIGPLGLAGAVDLAVAPGVAPVVRTADGEVWRYSSDFRWTSQASTLSEVFYPG